MGIGSEDESDLSLQGSSGSESSDDDENASQSDLSSAGGGSDWLWDCIPVSRQQNMDLE